MSADLSKFFCGIEATLTSDVFPSTSEFLFIATFRRQDGRCCAIGEYASNLPKEWQSDPVNHNDEILIHFWKKMKANGVDSYFEEASSWQN